ncbi:MAG: hypothetical protein HGA37_12260 [Lentimicrobium sp.]|nr:hypothetical protein [Lentimicrobium sp.]
MKNEGEFTLNQIDTLPEENDISEAEKMNEEVFIESVIKEPVLSSSKIEKSENRKPEFNPVPKEIKKPEQPLKAVRKISKILVFYNDRTFVEYSPGEDEI